MTELTIWCDAGRPPASDGHTVLWDEFVPVDAPDSWHSLPDAIHADRDSLRDELLAGLHTVGESTHGSRSLVERMRIRPYLSYWWMTLPADFSLGADSPTYAAVRMIALTRLADRLAVESVCIVASDREVREALVGWARATGRPATAVAGSGPRRLNQGSFATRAREFAYRAAPPLAALRILVAHLPIARRRPPPAAKHDGITVVDYLAHLALPVESPGAFGSNYWGPLVALLDEHDHRGEPVTYLHLSADRASAAVVHRDSTLVHRLTESSPGPVHDLLLAHLTWRGLGSSIRDYARVVRYGLTTRHIERMTSAARPMPWLRPFRRARRDQFYGATAMLNCLWINLFEATLRDMPYQRLGIYLMENQPWETAFTTIWRASGHGRLIGVIHSTAQFWNTRLFRDPRDYWADDEGCSMPWPDVVTVNGPTMRAACAQAGYPSSRMVDVEALRYLHLLSSPAVAAAPVPSIVLVLGEYSAEASTRLLDLVARAADVSDAPTAFAFRPHPAADFVDLTPYPRITLDHHISLSDALDAADLAVCGASSSAAVDAASRGVPTVLVSDPHSFFSSPAEGQPGTAIAKTAEDLSPLLLGGMSRRFLPDASASGLLLDSSLPRWRALLTTSDPPSRN